MSSFTEDEREEKLRHLMDVYGDGLKRLCCVYLRDLGLAEDAVQETFIKAYDHIDELLAGEIESAKAWLMRIAVNTCARHGCAISTGGRKSKRCRCPS